MNSADFFNKTQKITLAIDFGNCYIKAAIYQENISFAQPVVFRQEIPELIPSIIYLPQNADEKVLFGKDAIEAGLEDHEGLIYHIPHAFSNKNEIISLPNRISVNKQEIINSIFSYIYQETLQYNTNNKPIDNCQIIESADMSISFKRSLLLAAKNTHFINIQTRNLYQSLLNQWIYEVKLENYQETNHLIILDVNYNKTDIIALEKQNNLFNLNKPNATKQLDFGRDNLELITWDNLVASNYLGEIDHSKDLSNTIKIKVIREAAKNTNLKLKLHQKEFAGTVVELPKDISVKSEISFSEELSKHLTAFTDSLPESFKHATIIVAGELIDYTEVKSTLSNTFPGQTYSPNRPELTACVGGCLPDDFNKLINTTKNTEIVLAPNVTFGAYTILRKLGKGGMGEVWLAQHNIMKNKVAIKTLHPRLIKSKDSIDRFMAEIRNTAMLSHQNIVRAHDAGFMNGIYYMVNDYIDGHELSSSITNKQPLSENEVLKIGLDVATALDYAWDKHKILHRDIKPENIMIDQDGKTMLMDMGIAKSMLEQTPTMTTKDTLLGTPHYMSPEQVSGNDTDFRSDIYSLGATLFHLITGESPYTGESIITVASKHLTEPVPDVIERNGSVSKETAVLIEKMMQKKAEDRQQSWQQVVSEIKDLLFHDNNAHSYHNERTSKLIMKLFILLMISTSVILTGVILITAMLGGENNTNHATPTIRVIPADAVITVIKDGNIYKNYDKISINKGELFLPNGEYTVEVIKNSHKSITKKILKESEKDSFSFTLNPISSYLHIQTEPFTTVAIVNDNAERFVIGSTNIEGKLDANIHIGSFNIELSKEHFSPKIIDVTLLEDEPLKIKKKLKLLPNTLFIRANDSYEIYADDQLIGKTNESITNFHTIPDKLEIRKANYVSSYLTREQLADISHPINIDSLQIINITVHINKLEFPKSLIDSYKKQEIEIKIGEQDWQKVSLPTKLSNLESKKQTLQIRSNLFSFEPSVMEIDPEKDQNPSFNLIASPAIVSVNINSKFSGKLSGSDGKIYDSNTSIMLPAYTPFTLTVNDKTFIHEKFVIIPDPIKNNYFTFPVPQRKKVKATLRVKAVKELQGKFDLPTNGIIMINNASWQKTSLPVEIDNFSCAEYNFELQIPQFEVINNKKTITISPEGDNIIEYEIQPTPQPVIITSNSSNAIIYNNNQPIAKNKQLFYLDPFVEHTITIKADGYEDYILKVHIQGNELGKNKEINIMQKRTSILQKKQNITLPPFNIQMIYVPPGTFTMGSNNFLCEEKPAFKAKISKGFWISETEVTQQLYEKIMTKNPSRFKKPNNPVERVSWFDAVEFCEKYTKLLQHQKILLNKDAISLPTEAQWEFAAYANSSTIFTSGSDLTSSNANFDGLVSFTGLHGNFIANTTRVKSYPPNNLGIYDMHGNVYEWCLDYYQHGHNPNRDDEITIDPSGNPNQTGEFVLKGGSWKSYAKNCRISARYNRSANSIDNQIGFRFIIIVND